MSTGDGRWGRPIEARPALHRDRARLADLVDDLTGVEWLRPTMCTPWLVRDVVAHLLGDDLARLSRARDGHPSGDGPAADEALPTFLARLNARWVDACRGLSPRVLGELLRESTPRVLRYWDELDLDVLGEPVSWAGPQPAPRWLDCARDVTEYWVHQRQLREALGRPVVVDDEVDRIAIDTFLRAVPHTLRSTRGESFLVRVEGSAGGEWAWHRVHGVWTPVDGPPPEEPTATVTLGQEVLWRLCSRMITPERAGVHAVVDGDRRLGAAMLRIVAVVTPS